MCMCSLPRCVEQLAGYSGYGLAFAAHPGTEEECLGLRRLCGAAVVQPPAGRREAHSQSLCLFISLQGSSYRQVPTNVALTSHTYQSWVLLLFLLCFPIP
jgi:hypothetical protein